MPLFLAYFDTHPDRSGESCPFPDLHLEYVFGRGCGNGRDLRVRQKGRPRAE
jgi:hypothetical protein